MASCSCCPSARNQPFCKPEPMSVAEASQKVKQLRASVLSRWVKLNAIVMGHEELIRKRWEKKTRQKREKILLEVWPDIPKMHRPDLQALHDIQSYNVQHNYESFRNSLCWPHINLEDLRELEPLLLLMHSRGWNKPYAFALLDMDPMFFITTLAPALLQSTTEQTHGIMLFGATSDESYGEVKQLETASSSTPLSPKVHPGHGIKILEIQDWILHFLIRTCYSILHDVEITDLALEKPLLQKDSNICTWNEPFVTSHVTAMHHLPYRLPTRINLDGIQQALLAKIGSARDHIWALREDPGYFELLIHHHQELLLLYPSGETLELHERHDELFAELPREYATLPHRFIAQAYRALHVWVDLHDLVAELKSQPDLFSEAMYVRQSEPSGTQSLILYFASRLQSRAIMLSTRLIEVGVIEHSSSLNQYRRKTSQTRHQRSSPNRPSELKPSDFMEQAAEYAYHYQVQSWRDLQIVFEALKKAQASSSLPKCFQTLLSTTLDDLALILEILHTVHLCEAWITVLRTDWAAAERYGIAQQVHAAIKICNLTGLWDPSDGKFKYPIGKPRSEKVVESMRSAERSLDNFWRVFDDQCFGTLGETLHDFIREEIGPERELERTEQWDPTRTSDKQIGTSSCQTYEVPNTVEPSEEIVLQLRAKVKTRGVPDPMQNLKECEDVETNEEEVSPRGKYSVSKRGIKVFSTLFHNVDDEERPREIPWSSFVHAMVSIGFAAEKRYGSVWCFKPKDDAAQRNIEIHEPHDGKITYSLGRRIGRRLNRAYGWNGETFVRTRKSESGTDDLV